MIDYSKIITAEDKLRSAVEAKLAQINSKSQGEVDQYLEGYPSFERETWPTQQAEAKAYLADPAAATPWCDRAAAKRKMDRLEFLGRVVAKVAAFEVISADVAGYRQRLEDQIRAIDLASPTAQADLDAIVWAMPPADPPEQPES